MKKRILALVLTVVMLLSLVPGQVFAAQTETIVTEQTQSSVQTPQEEVTIPAEETTEAEETDPAEEPSETEETAPAEETVVTEEAQEEDKTEYKTTVVLDESYPLTFSEESIKADMTYLVETLGIRQAGSDNEHLAQEYVAGEFEKCGYDVRTQDVTLSQPVGTSSWNVIATKYGTKNTDMTIYVTAHVDSVPRGPGANDNASGIAGMLALARAFKDIETNYNICFVSFCGEEYGKQGSAYFAQNMTESQKLNAIVGYNLDMIATKNSDCKYMLMMSASNENGSFENYATVSARAAAQTLGYGSQHFNVIQGYNADHASLHDAGIPAAEFFWNKNTTNLSVESYYHTAQDNLNENFELDKLIQMTSVVGLAVYNEATAEFAAVVGEDAYRDYYTSLEEATAAATASGETLRQIYSFDLAEGHSHTMSTDCHVSTNGDENLDYTPLYAADIKTLFTSGVSGNFVLMEDVTYSGWITVTGMNVNLCLNGHKITNNNQYAAYEFKGTGTLNICDCTRDQSGAFYSDKTQALLWTNSSNFNLHIYSGQSFDKEKASGTYASAVIASGGNVYVHDGYIYGYYPALDVDGGNVYLSGGEVKGITYGVYVEGGTFYLSGDPIINGPSGDIRLKSGKYINIAGPIHPANNDTYSIVTASTPGDGQAIQLTVGWGANKGDTDISIFRTSVEGCVITEKFDANGVKELYLEKNVHYHDQSNYTSPLTKEYLEGTYSSSYYHPASGYYHLAEDLTLDSQIMVSGDTEIHICLSGKNLTSTAQSVFQTAGNGKVYIHDCSKKGTVIGQKIYATGNSEIYLRGGTFTLTDQRILLHAQGGTIVVDGATVNTTSTRYGGAVVDGGTIEIKSGSIIEHGANMPGVYVDSGTFKLSGNPTIKGGAGGADISLGGDAKITVTGPITAQAGGYTVQISKTLQLGEDYQLTVGWEENAGSSNIPFVPANDKYIVREMNGELYMSYVPPHTHEDTTEPFAKMLYAPAGKTVNIFETIMNGGTFYLDGEGDFEILDTRASIQTPLSANIRLCLNGRTISMGQAQLSGKVYFCDCTDHGVFNQTGYWQISGETTIYSVYINSTTDVQTTGQAMTPFLMKSGKGKLLIDSCTIEGLGSKKIVGYEDYNNSVEIRNSTLLSHKTGVGVDVEVPKLTLSGTTVIDADNNADIRLSYTYNKSGDPSIINIGKDFNVPEGQEITVSLEKNGSVPVIVEGAPIQITVGWGEARNAQGLKGQPFVYYPDNIPGNYDDEYEAYEMITDEGEWEIWVGIPHKHYDEDGNVIAKFYYHITQANCDKFKWDQVQEKHLSWVAGTYFMLEDATIPDGTTAIVTRGDMHLCLNDHTLSFNREFDVDAVDSTTTIEDCGDEGTAIFQSYRAKFGRLVLLGGTIIGFDPDGAAQAWPGREIVVDGATLVSTATAPNSDEPLSKFGVPYSKMCPTIYGEGDGSSITMKNGVIKKEGVDGNAVLIYGGSYKLEGTMDIDCVGNYADFYFYNHIPIEITGKVTPPEGELYSVEIRPVLKRGETYRITEGWSEKSECDYIPFVSTQGYIVFLEPTDGEIYLTPPQVTVTVNDESMGYALADPDHGPGGNDYYGKVRTHVEFNAAPYEGYYIKSITMYYAYDIEREYVDKIYKSMMATTPNIEYKQLDCTYDENGGAFAEFDMPLNDIFIHVEFAAAKLENPVNILLWKDKDTGVTQEMLFAELLKADASNSFLKEDGDYTFTAITEDLEVLTVVKTDKGYTFVGSDGGEYTGALTVSYVNNETGEGGSFLVDLTPMVYDVKDTVYILDYDIALKMNEGFTAQDILPGVGENGTMDLLPEGYVTSAPDMSKLKSVNKTHTGTYGAFSIGGAGEILYTPKNGTLINGSDKIYTVFRVHEKGITPNAVGTVNPFNEVEMYKEITIVPANVVYYEDTNKVMNWNPDKAAGISVIDLGSSNGAYQDGNTETPHGNDPAYTYAPNGTYNGSGGTSKKIVVTGAGTILSFSFTGTGFDLLGRTTADSGYFIYKVYDTKVSNTTPIKQAALNTNYTGDGSTNNAAIYEVPVVHVQDLTYGTYRVELQAVVSYDWNADKSLWNGNYPPVIPMTLYFDGVRIFNPLAENDSDRGYYADGEDTATFLQIRDLIVKGQAASAKFDANGTFSYGSGLISYTEKGNGRYEFEGINVSSVNQYLLAGPNNEVYFNENSQSLVFFVKETGTDAHMLQIGIRNLNPEAFDGAEGDKNNTPEFAVLGAAGKTVQTLVSANKTISYTEQYYTIDYKNCVVDTLNGSKYYRVVITAKNSSALSLSNLKVSGLEIYTNPALAATVKYDEFGQLVYTDNAQTAEMPNLYMIARQIRVASGMLPEDEIPAENAELKFRSLSLSLQSSIGLNLYVAKETLVGYSDPYVLLSKTVYDMDGNASVKTVKLYDYETVQVSGQDCIRFDYSDLSAKEMNSNVTVQLFATKDDVICTVAGESRDYSVVQYAKNMLAKNISPKLNTLLVDMVNYGTEAQLYFGYNTASLANADFDAYQSYATVETPEMVSCNDKEASNPYAPLPEGEQYVAKIPGASLLLEDKVKVNIFVDVMDIYGQTNEGRTLMVAYTNANGQAVMEEILITAEALDSNGKYYRVTFDSLNATDMGTSFLAWVVEDGQRISNTLSYSIESYGASVMSGSSAAQLKLQPLLSAMMKYGNAAEGYFGTIR